MIAEAAKKKNHFHVSQQFLLIFYAEFISFCFSHNIYVKTVFSCPFHMFSCPTTSLIHVKTTKKICTKILSFILHLILWNIFSQSCHF